MGFFPDVSKGDPFQPNSVLENNVRRIVNSLNGFQGGMQLGAASGIVKVQVYCSSALEAGTAVNFSDSGNLCGDAIPCEKLKDPAKPFGVIVRKLAAKEIGDCIISGPATVKISGSSGNYAQPNKSNPATFQRGATGAQILFASNGKAVINLGAATQENYTGPFAVTYDAETKKLKVAAGYLSRNGEWKDVAAKELSASSSGTICVCTSLGSDGSWTEPEVKISTPGQFAYPVGSVKTEGESVTICNFRVPVAIFISADVCSTTN